MDLRFASTVIITQDLDKMKAFYLDILGQDIEADFGECIAFKSGISLWKLTADFPIAQHLGRTFDAFGNKNLELSFETEDYDSVVKKLEAQELNYLHKTTEEMWGQYTIRFYDPENNLIEVGESIPCFVKRIAAEGLSAEEVSTRTSVPVEYVAQILKG